MNEIKLNLEALPGLYQSADKASIKAQSSYFLGLRLYLILLTLAALISFLWPKDCYSAILSAALFLITLGILVILRVKRPDDIWYNGRAVAESVKTRAWRWVMRADPYENTDNLEIVSKQFINDLKAILYQNKNLSEALESISGVNDAISTVMNSIRRLSVEERLTIYKEQRIKNQANWYASKSQFNKKRAKQWFWVSIFLHAIAIGMLLYRIKEPDMSLPVAVVATAAGAVLTWLQAKKYNELNSSYALAAHEIVLIKGEALSVKNEKKLSEFVINSENAFSREHTQWTAKKVD